MDRRGIAKEIQFIYCGGSMIEFKTAEEINIYLECVRLLLKDGYPVWDINT